MEEIEITKFKVGDVVRIQTSFFGENKTDIESVLNSSGGSFLINQGILEDYNLAYLISCFNSDLFVLDVYDVNPDKYGSSLYNNLEFLFNEFGHFEKKNYFLLQEVVLANKDNCGVTMCIDGKPVTVHDKQPIIIPNFLLVYASNASVQKLLQKEIDML